MTLHVFNRLTRQKEEFKPLIDGEVRMYVCGPTVYDHAHLGHAKTYVSFDVIVRYLRWTGLKVRYVQNITDVGHLLETDEDRVQKKAGQLGVEPMEVVETYTRSYFEDMDALGVIRPDISPRASGHVPEQIEMAQTLIDKGYAYVTEAGDVYFDVTSFDEYGKLSGKILDDLQSEREIVGSDKRDQADFALWRHAEPEHLMRWKSPWGVGFPGWHIECSAMANKYLGATFDIHGGGLENQFPHNECEIAQSEAANEVPFANYWLLTGSLTVDGVKMSKSLFNFVTVKEALETYKPEVIRYFILNSHYSNPVDFSEGALAAAAKGLDGLLNTVRLVRYKLADTPDGGAGGEFFEQIDEFQARFVEAMDDDFNAPMARAVLHDFAKEVNTLLNSGQEVSYGVVEAIDTFFRDLGGYVLGIIPDELDESGGAAELLDGVVDLLIDMRNSARQNKDYAQADAIRDRLADLGVILEDRADGTIFKIN